MATMITKKQAAGYIARGEHDYTLTFFDFYQTILDLHTQVEELQERGDRLSDQLRDRDIEALRPGPNAQHKLIDNWGM